MHKSPDGRYHYTGAVHIHTTESDGTRPINEVIEFGKQVGLDFMMFSEHMSMNNREAGLEGRYGDTLVTIGYEHNDLKDHHHYLLFGAPRVYPKNMSVAQYVAAGAADGALGIMAHPDEIRNVMPQYPPYPWTDWDVEGFDGLELWNQMSEWMERLTRYNKLLMCLSPRKCMRGPSDRILKRWDEISANRRCVGIASVDAHAFPVKIGPIDIEIFPYKVHFRCLRTIVVLSNPLSDDFETAKGQLYDAIRNCSVYFANIRWGNSDGFAFTINNGVDEVTCGGEVNLTEATTLKVSLPSKVNLSLIHNGEVVFKKKTKELEMSLTEPGIYRVEAHRRRRGWIYSNHIRVTK